MAHEDLSYALYVHEYSSGRFFKAREEADKAIKIMEVRQFLTLYLIFFSLSTFRTGLRGQNKKYGYVKTRLKHWSDV